MWTPSGRAMKGRSCHDSGTCKGVDFPDSGGVDGVAEGTGG
jgi:hypothetical protein